MELHYLNPTKSLIVAHLDAGETLGTLEGGEHGKTDYIKVDGTDPNYAELLKTDPTLETVNDPGEVKAPPPAEAPPTEPPAHTEAKAPAHQAAPAHAAAPAPKPAAPAPAPHKK